MSYNQSKISNIALVKQSLLDIGREIPGQYKKQIFVVIKSTEQGQQVLWVAKVHLLFLQSATDVAVVEEVTYVQYIEMTEAVFGVKTVLRCVCMR